MIPLAAAWEFKPWTADAKCAGKAREYDPDMIAERLNLGRALAKHMHPIARALCDGCPVTKECALDVLDHPEDARYSIRAGVYISARVGQVRHMLMRPATGHPLPPFPPSPHGTVGMYRNGCQCSPCNRALKKAERDSKRRLARKQAQALPQVPSPARQQMAETVASVVAQIDGSRGYSA